MINISKEQAEEFKTYKKLVDDGIIDIDDLHNKKQNINKSMTELAQALKEGRGFAFKPIQELQKDKRRFIKMYIDSLPILVNNLKSLNDVKVFLTLLTKINTETGAIDVPQYEISETTGIDAPGVSKALKSLVKNQYLVVDEKTIKRRQKTYFLNTDYFMYGRPNQTLK